MQDSTNKQVAKEAFIEALTTFRSLPMDNIDLSAHRSALAKVQEKAAAMLDDRPHDVAVSLDHPATDRVQHDTSRPRPFDPVSICK